MKTNICNLDISQRAEDIFWEYLFAHRFLQTLLRIFGPIPAAWGSTSTHTYLRTHPPTSVSKARRGHPNYASKREVQAAFFQFQKICFNGNVTASEFQWGSNPVLLTHFFGTLKTCLFKTSHECKTARTSQFEHSFLSTGSNFKNVLVCLVNDSFYIRANKYL